MLRTAPCLLGLLNLVGLIFHRLWDEERLAAFSDFWYARKEVTFSDGMAAVRRLCWSEVLTRSWKHAGVTRLPSELRLTLKYQLCRAA